MNKFSKHIGKDCFVIIDEDRFDLKQLSTDSISDYLTVAKAFSGANEQSTPKEIFSNFNVETSLAVKNLVEQTLKRSFPDEWKDDCDELKSFGMKYLMVLLPKILEINSSTATIEQSKKDKIISRLNKNVKSDKDS